MQSKMIAPMPTELDKCLGWRDAIYVLPLFLALFATVFSPHKPLQNVVANTILQAEGYRTWMFGGIYLLAALLVLTRFTTAMRQVARHVPYLLFLVFVVWSVTWSAHPEKVLITWGHYLGFYLICLSAVVALEWREWSFYNLFFAYGTIAVVATLVIVVFFPDRGIVDVGGKLRWLGFTNSPNSLGVMMLVTVWVCMIWISACRAWLVKLLVGLLLLPVFFCIYGSDSMTSAILAVLVVLLVPVLMSICALSPSRAAGLFGGFLLLTTVAVLILYVALPELFVAKSVLGNLTLIGRSATFTGRTSLWTVALQAISERPLLGWSFDALYSVGDRFIVRASHFHNGYLELLVTGGSVGLSLILTLVGIVVWRIIILQRVLPRLAAAMAVLLMLILLHNLAEASLGRTPTLLWLIFTLMYLVLAQKPPTDVTELPPECTGGSSVK